MTIRRLFPAAAATALLLVTSSSAAQVPPPNCQEPTRPAELKTQEAISAWAQAVEAYQQCLMSYSARQKQLSDVHAKAANDAVARWNDFVGRMNSQ